MIRTKLLLLSVSIAMGALALPATAQTTFTIAPSSTLTFGLTVGGFAVGSDTTTLSGDLLADVTKDAAGNATDIDFSMNTGSPISATGWSISLPFPLTGTITGTGTGANVGGSSPVTGTTFDASLITLTINQGMVDAAGTIIDLATVMPSGTGTSSGTLTTATAAEGGCTITYPIDFSQSVVAGPPEVVLQATGTITLVGDCCPVPEPGGLGLSLVSLSGVLLAARRRRK